MAFRGKVIPAEAWQLWRTDHTLGGLQWAPSLEGRGEKCGKKYGNNAVNNPWVQFLSECSYFSVFFGMRFSFITHLFLCLQLSAVPRGCYICIHLHNWDYFKCSVADFSHLKSTSHNAPLIDFLFSRSVASSSLRPPWTAARQASLPFTISPSLLKIVSVEIYNWTRRWFVAGLHSKCCEPSRLKNTWLLGTFLTINS